MTNKYSNENHPCFNKAAKRIYSRVHLPIAPKCNVQCNFCNRKYDCVNESRPGVTSSVLTPQQAVNYLVDLDERIENLSVIGIAGPGDPMANPEETLTTLRLIKEAFPEKMFCLSTNGLNLKTHIEEMASLGVSHVTITINAVDTAIIEKIYAWIRYENQVYTNKQGAEILLNNQLSCIPLLKEKGIIVKMNTVVIPGINDRHIPEIAKKVAELGADLMNCIPLIPTKDTTFENLEEPTGKQIAGLRLMVQDFLPVMTHCSRCRADAAGLLGKDLPETMGMLKEYASDIINNNNMEERTYVAVASNDGLLVDSHLGQVTSLLIFKQTHNGSRLIEKRTTPGIGMGDFRWMKLSNILKDCKVLLVSKAGPNPVNILKNSGIRIIKMTGLIDEGLDAVYNNSQIEQIEGGLPTGNCNQGDYSSQGCA